MLGGGLLLGGWIPRVAAAALAAVASYSVIGFAWTLPVVSLRYLVGTGVGLCCTSAKHLDHRAVLAAALMSLGTAAGLLLLHTLCLRPPAEAGRRRAAVFGSGTIMLLAGILGGLGAAYGVGPEPTLAYDAADCAPGTPKVCLNPVQRSRADLAAPIRGAFTALEAAGMPKVEKVTARGRGEVLNQDGTADLSIDPGMDAEEAMHSAAGTYAAATDDGQCAAESWWRDRLLFEVWLDATAARGVLGEEAEAADYERARDELAGDAVGRARLEQFLAADERTRAAWARSFYDGRTACAEPTLPTSGARG